MLELQEIGVVVVNYHMNKSCTALVYDLLHNQGIARENLIVIDNSANVELQDSLSALYKFNNVVVANNIGYGAAMNLGVSLLPENIETLVLLTHEVVLQEFAVRRLALELSSLSEVAILGPTLMKISDGEVWSLGGSFSGLRCIPYHFRLAEDVTESSIAWLDGACLVMRLDTWNSIGGFDTDFFLYFEDVDLCMRAAKTTGKRVSVSDEVIVWQEPSGNLSSKIVDESFPFLLIKHANVKALVAWIIVRCLSIARSILKGTETPKSYFRIFSGVLKGIKYRKRIKNHAR
jgi:GT2 family glycosyltransferase